MPRKRTLFISYRRDDASGWAGRLEADLRFRLGTDVQVFMDVDAIPAGEDFARVIDDAVSRSDALVALIGPGWVTAQDTRGRRRLDDPNDLVRIEIETALQRGTRVIPVLVGGASLPSPKVLPETLRDLTRRQAVRLDHETWSLGLSRLVRVLERRSVFDWFKDIGALAAIVFLLTTVLLAPFDRRMIQVMAALSLAYLLLWAHGLLLGWLRNERRTLLVLAAALVLTGVAAFIGHGIPRSADIVGTIPDAAVMRDINIHGRSRGIDKGERIWVAWGALEGGECYVKNYTNKESNGEVESDGKWQVNGVAVGATESVPERQFRLFVGTVDEKLRQVVETQAQFQGETAAFGGSCPPEGFDELDRLQVIRIQQS